MGAGRTGRGEIGEPVHHQHVHRSRRPGQLEGLLHPGGDGQVAEHAPRLVHDDDAMGVIRSEGGLQPGGHAGHQHRKGGEGRWALRSTTSSCLRVLGR